MLKRLIIHPFTFAIFPILALLAYNIKEVTPRVALRPLVISLLGALLFMLVFRLISRSLQKAALITTSFMVLFFSYGHIYEFLQQHAIFGFSLGRHRYLIAIYAVLFIIALWQVLRKVKDAQPATQVLNIIGLLILVLPVYQISSYSITVWRNAQRSTQQPPAQSELVVQPGQALPDIYFIILDGYTRQDALLSDFNYDNTAFLDDLRKLGFYVADCSRSNYQKTQGSLAAALNMNYMPELDAALAAQGLNDEDIGVLVKHSQVRKLLESIGYLTVAFDSGFEWSRISDADVYLQYSGKPYELQVPQPFEVILLRTTALQVWFDSQLKLPAHNQTPFTDVNFTFDDHINRQLYIMDELPHLASFSGPKFVFAHIMIPHVPYVFEPDGQIATDPGYYSSPDSNGPVDEGHLLSGYTNEIQFLNNRLPAILDALITQSRVPPIILLLGDHGLGNENRLENLSAYYLPDGGPGTFYPNITPVNAFRLIFDTRFGTHYGLLADTSYDETNQPVPETSPACLP